MAKRYAPKSSPSWGKWWFDDWRLSSLRMDLKTPTRRYIYRELWDFLMSQTCPGAALFSEGRPIPDSEIAGALQVRALEFRQTIDVLTAHGRIERGQSNELRLPEKDVTKSLPDHWKYNRLHAKQPDGDQKATIQPPSTPQENRAPKQKQRQKSKKNTAHSSAEATPQPRNVLWDVLCEEFSLNPVTANEKSLIGKCIKTLKAKGATPDDVHTRHVSYCQEFPNAPDTMPGLINQWDYLGRADRQTSGNAKQGHGDSATQRRAEKAKREHAEPVSSRLLG